LVEIIEKLAQFWLKQGQDKRATRLYGAAAGIRQRLNLTVSHLDKTSYEQNLDLLKNRLGPRLFKQAWAKGTNLPIQESLKVGLGANPRLNPHLRSGQNRPNPEPAPNGEVVPLSQREKEVLYLVATGLTNPQIARQMNLSTYTVSSYLRSIYNKLGVTTRTAAASYAFKNLYKLP
jgi:DNA-binding CsgD family transcriptional regulator